MKVTQDQGVGKKSKSARKRASQRKQKSTPNPEGASTSQDLPKQSTHDFTVIPQWNPGGNSDAHHIPKGTKDDPSPSTSKHSSSNKKRSRSSRKNLNTEKSQDGSLQSHDQYGLAKNAGPPQRQIDPKKEKTEKQDLESPTPVVSRRSRKKKNNAGSISSTQSNFFKEVVDVNVPNKSSKKATNEPNLTIKFNPHKAIKKEAKSPQKGLQTSRKKATDSNSSVNWNANKNAKSEVKPFELPVQCGSQKPKKMASSNETNSNKVATAPSATNSHTKFHPNQIGVRGPPTHLGGQGMRKFVPEFNNCFNFNAKKNIERQDCPTHCQQPEITNQFDRNKCITSQCDPNLVIKEEVKEELSIKEEIQDPETPHYISSQFNPNITIEGNVQDPESSYQSSPTQSDTNRPIESENCVPNIPLWYDSQNSNILPTRSTDADDSWANLSLNMFDVEQVVDTHEFFAGDSTVGNNSMTNVWELTCQAGDQARCSNQNAYQQAQNNDSGFVDRNMTSQYDFADNQDSLSFDVVYGQYAQFGSKNEASYNSEEAAMDARFEAELDSLFESLDTAPMPEPEKNDPPTKTEAEMDARLQAELDSLPFIEAPVEALVEPPVEADNYVDDLISTFLNPGQQAEQPSNAVPNQAPVEADNYMDDLFSTFLNLGQQAEQPSNAVPNQVLPLSNVPTAPTTVAPTKNLKVLNPGTFQKTAQQPMARKQQQRPLSQVPMVAQVTGLQGQVVSLTYTTAPDGLVTSVSATSPETPLAQELQSLTASQMHQILQSAQPYLALPMIVPGGQEAGELGLKDAAGIVAPTGQAVEDEEVDYEEIGVADTFAEYWPSKLKFGMSHPDPVVETATLSSVELPDITYELALSPRTTSCLSALQLEAVIYACQAHEQILPSGERAGFLLGDGAGVGKGRTIAGIIFDNYMKGRKRALWVSVSNDLKFDAERDLHDIGADDKVKVVAINRFKYSRIDSDENENFTKGVIFCTYTALIGESQTSNSKYKTRLRQLVSWLGKKFDGVIVFDECHKAKNLSLMNVGKSTKTGTTVLDLQKLLPQARVVYASATGASEPRNMAYMVRLGLWGPGTAYSEFFEFVNAVEKRGIGAMEIVAMDMKLRGTYIARQLSFKDVTFRIEEVPMSRESRKTYNLAAELWAEINKKFIKACRLMCIENRVQKIITCQFWCAHQRFFKNLCIASKVNHVVRMTRQATRMGKAVVIGLQSTGESRTLEHLERHNGRLTSFVSTSKMIIQSFVEKHFPAPKRDSFHRLLNTGEFEPEPRYRPPRSKKAKMSADWFDDDMDAEAEDSDIEMYESNDDDDRLKAGRKRRGRPPKTEKAEKITMQERILQHLCNNMRAQDNDNDATYTFDNTKMQKANITEHDVERCIRAREMLLDKIEVLGRRMPSNTLDKLISELGGTKLVAEMTGRRGRVVRTEYDGFKYEPRCENDTSMDLVNYREKQRFMVGAKHVAIISEAASSGISLQSDKRVSNQRRRLHITLELPWSADRAIQQFGRTHRSNQVNSPEYVFVITDLAGERRFASTVAKRLESLGALTQGDRRATDARDLSQFNIDNSIGRSALENVMQQLTGEKPLDHANVPASYKGDFLYDCSVAMAGVGMLNVREENKVKLFSVEKDSNNISKFLNRILGCRVEVQNALFKFFLDKMYSLILQMKRKGHFDLGILDLDAHGACVKSVKLMRFVRKHATGTAATELHTVTVERGMSYETALAKYRKEGRHDHDGFYVLQQLRHNKNSAILCLHAKSNAPEGAANSSPSKISLQLYRPNTGPQVRLETLGSILTRYEKVEPEAARDFWQQQHDLCLDKCSHVYWNGACPFAAGCEVGLRVRPYHVLSGLMLPIWDRIEVILEKSGHKIQIIRVKTDVNKKIVGTVVPHGVYDALVADLSADSIVESH
ncbi:protein strawberry notch homolog 1 isoform X2 [Drosophila kikkawai]|uniref:Protein strawberry notch homolog 1 isoform X2 n=1 Tax=Drosophila kikkawai TaxID=30033 RepID=A0A6P4JRJ1_DROKI|nr:protein strawberry notch homolog 1 isoform X2 [Drosophila kikkawai]